MEIHTRPHGAALVGPLARALFLALVGAVAVLLGAEVHWVVQVAGAALLVLAAWLALRTVLAWERTSIVVGGDRLMVSYGVVRRHAATVRLDDGTAVEVEQTIPGRLLGYGTVIAGHLEVPHVPHARDLLRS